MELIDYKNWNRREHFEFFSKYDEPFFGLVTEVECTQAYQTAKANGWSFFAYYLHQSIRAVNQIEEFRYRIINGKVARFKEIHAASTIGRPDGTFGFSFMPFSEDFSVFKAALNQEIQEVLNSSGLRANEDAIRPDVIHYSTLPWNKFTGLTHARNFKKGDSVPKISFGKAYIKDEKRFLPVSIDAHHGLVDGFHVAKYLEIFQGFLENE
ncbi:chloramphenicol acetyltransferase [Flexithrix dorotheae]|uniref:chloramphenicol acetyltransferase n=1 Tax=Flexithrix dorotheae TaxID=70993 RepID=UPI000377F7C6|nr:chloramphenicol acetyltransferase [Flexithrix dorotheae]